MSKPKGLVLDGKPLATFLEPPGVEQLLDFLDAVPSGTLLSTDELAKQIKASKRTILEYGRTVERIQTRCHRIHACSGPKLVWGSGPTIVELRRQMGAK